MLSQINHKNAHEKCGSGICRYDHLFQEYSCTKIYDAKECLAEMCVRNVVHANLHAKKFSAKAAAGIKSVTGKCSLCFLMEICDAKNEISRKTCCREISSLRSISKEFIFKMCPFLWFFIYVIGITQRVIK